MDCCALYMAKWNKPKRLLEKIILAILQNALLDKAIWSTGGKIKTQF